MPVPYVLGGDSVGFEESKGWGYRWEGKQRCLQVLSKVQDRRAQAPSCLGDTHPHAAR